MLLFSFHLLPNPFVYEKVRYILNHFLDFKKSSRPMCTYTFPLHPFNTDLTHCLSRFHFLICNSCSCLIADGHLPGSEWQIKISVRCLSLRIVAVYREFTLLQCEAWMRCDCLSLHLVYVCHHTAGKCDDNLGHNAKNAFQCRHAGKAN